MLERLPIALADFPGVTSVVVAQHGDTVAEWYAEGDDGRTVLRNTRSATKTVTGMLVGIAVDDGSIDVEASVVSYLGERPSIQAPVAAAGVTVAELLTMSSCLDCDDSDDESPGNEERMHPAEDWLAFASSIPLRSPCGPPRFRYCTAHTVLLGAAVEAATGTELSQYASARLFGPLGIQGERWFRSSAGVAFPGGGLELRSSDLLALGELLRNGGAVGSRRVLSAAWVDQSTLPHAAVDADTDYGYLLWLRRYATGSGEVPCWMMLGNGGNKVVVLPSLAAVVVLTAVNYGMPGMHELTDRLLREHVLPELV